MRLQDERVVAFLDIGTNSVRLLLARLGAEQSYAVITQQKEVVRLGEGAFPDRRLQPEAIRRAVEVCGRFAEMARNYQASEIIAVATSACREARNQEQLLRPLRREAGLDVRVISGKEEARLIYLGVASGIKLDERPALFIDIGGGSTEIAVGDRHQYSYLDTLKLGAIRLTSLYFLPEEIGPVSAARYSLLQRHVQNTALRTLQRLRAHRYASAFGSAGTIGALGDIAARLAARRGARRRDDVLTREQLRLAVRTLCELPLAQRRRLPGLAPERADIIIGGAAILETLLQQLDLPEIRISDRGLREGLLIDHLARLAESQQERSAPFRERSVFQLGRAFGFAEPHARQVARLSLQLFDSARAAKLHKLGDWERELLEYAALLHDVGVALSFNNHHAHSAYFIRHADLLGFDQTEIAIMAATAQYHRKQNPSKKHREFGELGARNRRATRMMASLLALAESLDRSHTGVVTAARLKARDRARAELELVAAADCQLEVWGARSQAASFLRAFGRKLSISARIEPPAADAGAVAESSAGQQHRHAHQRPDLPDE